MSKNKKKSESGSNFIIDNLTNSIENSSSGENFETVLFPRQAAELKFITKKNGWRFDWKSEFIIPQRSVFKLTIVENSTLIQGLISLEIKSDHVFVHLLESAPFNVGKNKVYKGVAGNLVAYACKLSLEYGHMGTVSLTSKTSLINHYVKTLGAVHVGARIMIIETESALYLIKKYFNI